MEFKVRRSRVLSQLKAGKTANCFKVNSSDPRVTEIVSRHGFDCIWTCMEHVGNDFSTIEARVWAAKGMMWTFCAGFPEEATAIMYGRLKWMPQA